MVDRTLDEYMEGIDNSQDSAQGQMCEICGEKKATNVCIKCGKHVCTSHFVTIMGLCVECAPVKLKGSAPDRDADIQAPVKEEAAGKNDVKTDRSRSTDEKPGIEWV